MNWKTFTVGERKEALLFVYDTDSPRVRNLIQYSVILATIGSVVGMWCQISKRKHSDSAFHGLSHVAEQMLFLGRSSLLFSSKPRLQLECVW